MKTANHNPLMQTRPDFARPIDTDKDKKDHLQRCFIFLGCGAFLCQFIAYNFVDIDLWHQMALIRESLSAGHLLTTDPYAYTPTLPWIDHEWGAGALAFFSTKWLGSRAIVLLKFLTALGTGFFCVRCSEARGANARILGMCAPLAIFLAYLGFLATIRAQAYSFFLTALWLWFLALDSRGIRRWIIYALAIFPLWVNLHAGFIVAIALTGAHAVENLLRHQPARHLLLLMSAMFLEIFLNPYGAGYFRYLYRALTMARPYAAEWGTISSLGNAWIAAFVLSLLVAVYSVWSAGWARASGVLVLASAAVEATLHRKLLPLFAIAWLCYVPSYLQATPVGTWWLEFTTRRARFVSTAWIALTCICAVPIIREKPWALSVPQPPYPVGAVRYLAKQRFAGNLLVPFESGAYVSWKLFPAVKVSLDSRYEVAFPDSVVTQVFDFYGARADWKSVLQAFPTDAVLIPVDASIAKLMPATNWQRVYADQNFQICARPGIILQTQISQTQISQTQDWPSTSFQGEFP
jgi:hypothetical protein